MDPVSSLIKASNSAIAIGMSNRSFNAYETSFYQISMFEVAGCVADCPYAARITHVTIRYDRAYR